MLHKIKHETFYYKIARKFYDSLLLYWARKGNEKELPIVYVLIIEHPILDKKLRKQLKIKIEKQLPFHIEDPLIQKQMLSNFEVMDVKEWEVRFPEIVISELQKIYEPSNQVRNGRFILIGASGVGQTSSSACLIILF